MSNVKAESFSSSLLVSVIPFTFLVCNRKVPSREGPQLFPVVSRVGY